MNPENQLWSVGDWSKVKERNIQFLPFLEKGTSFLAHLQHHT